MSKKIDFGAALSKPAPPDRFAQAQAVMNATGGSLLHGTGAPASSFHVETGAAPSTTSDGWAGAREIEMDLARLHDNPYGARSCYTEDLVAARAQSIKVEGQLEPIKVCRHPTFPGEYIVIDGGCRKRSLLVLGRSTGRVAVRDEVLAPLELHRLSRIYNKERDNGSVMDDALVWRRLLDDKVVADQDALATQVEVTKGQVSKTLAMLKMPPQVLAAIEANPRPVTASFGYQLYQFSTAVSSREDGVALTVELVGKVQREEISCLQIEKLRQRYEDGRERKHRETSRQYPLHRDGHAVGTLKEWDNGKVLLEVVLEDKELREQIVAELKQRFMAGEGA
jgi:ParB family chromosome partitioning protein